MTNQELLARHHASTIGNYGKLPAVLVRGEGSFVFDAEGRKYIDLFAGFGGTILGHCHPALTAALTAQAKTLWAVGNQFCNEPAIRLAEQLKAKAFDGRAFFCHSGAEANEAAIKLARLAARGGAAEGRFKIISMLNGFHGRTLGALSATPTLAYQQGFTPMTPGFVAVPNNDLPALAAAIDDQTAAVIVEPIQGEGGINLPNDGYLAGIRKLCDEKKIILIFDEVWTGVGRTGRYFGLQHYGVTPDIMSMGKALGGGIPVGGIVAKPEIAQFLKPGTHGCTLGGNPICMAVGAAIFEVLEKEGLPARAAELGRIAQHAIRNFRNAGSRIKDVRGKGLFLGIELQMADGTPVVQAALSKGLVINNTHKNVLRLCPSLAIEQATLEQGLTLLEEALNAV